MIFGFSDNQSGFKHGLGSSHAVYISSDLLSTNIVALCPDLANARRPSLSCDVQDTVVTGCKRS